MGCEKATEPIGIIRIVEVVCAIIAWGVWLGCMPAPWRGYINLDRTLFYSLLFCIVVSLILLILGIAGVENDYVSTIDLVYHVFMGGAMTVMSIADLDAAIPNSSGAHMAVAIFEFFLAIALAAGAYMLTKGGGGK